MDRREFLKGTAAAGAAAVLPLSILTEGQKDYAKLLRDGHVAVTEENIRILQRHDLNKKNPVFTYTTEADMRWLKRVQFRQDNGIYNILYLNVPDRVTARDRLTITHLLPTSIPIRSLCRSLAVLGCR
jgi:hypothetical protein